MVQLSHLYMTTGKTIDLTIQTFIDKVISLLFNMLSRFVITFLPRSKRLFISWRQSPYAVILETNKIKVCHCFHCSPIYLPWNDGITCHDLSFLDVVLSQFFHSPLSPLSRGSLVPLCFLRLLIFWSYWYFSRWSWFQLVLHPAWHFVWCTLHIN